MKKKKLSPLNADQLKQLCEVLVGIHDVEGMALFLKDLCTSSELEAMIDRWRVVAPLLAGQSYRDIAKETGVSVTTVSRVAKTLSEGRGYRMAIH